MRRVAMVVAVGCWLVLVAGSSMAQLPPSFSADTKSTFKNGTTANGKLYFSGTMARVETSAMGQQGVMISDQAKQMAYMLMPQQRMYMEIPLNANNNKKGPTFLMYDPNNPCAVMPGFTCTKIGPDMVGTTPTTKWQAKGSKTDLTLWIDGRGIPIKSQTPDVTNEVTNIQLGPQPASLFQVPSGYTKFNMGGLGEMMRNMRPE